MNDYFCVLLVRDGIKRHIDMSFDNISECNTGRRQERGKVISSKVYVTNDKIFS